MSLMCNAAAGTAGPSSNKAASSNPADADDDASGSNEGRELDEEADGADEEALLTAAASAEGSGLPAVLSISAHPDDG